LLRYFGDHLEQPCGNCDTCLEPPQTWDATVAAQKALSCVYRTGQRFGVNHLADLLLGAPSERARRLGHDRLSTFGIGTELDRSAWRGLFRQLIARGLLAVDLHAHGGLRLTEACRPVLRGEQSLMLRRMVKPGPARRRDRAALGYQDGADRALWEALKRKRKQLAEAQGVPAFVIFHDATLMEMVRHKPRSLAQMSEVSGVGDRKLAAYGAEFLAVIGDLTGGTGGVTGDVVG
jgi:ATP-dependent DNA helicase RecQ